MTEKQAKRVKIGTCVIWDRNPNDRGEIKQKRDSALFIKWKNGHMGWVDYRDCKRISVYKK